jgi:transcriptional regulator of acetoin/glycerol metabolism
VTKAVAVRQRPLPRLLRDKAERAGVQPQDHLVQALASAPTNEDAARSIGVTRNTLWRWCRLLDISVEVA